MRIWMRGEEEQEQEEEQQQQPPPQFLLGRGRIL
jgi:hypothetical protein